MEPRIYLPPASALGREWRGLSTSKGGSVPIAQTVARRLHWRLARIATHLGVSLADLADDLRVIDGSRADAELIAETRDGAMLTSAYTWLGEQMSGMQVVILDGASDAYGAREITVETCAGSCGRCGG